MYRSPKWLVGTGTPSLSPEVRTFCLVYFCFPSSRFRSITVHLFPGGQIFSWGQNRYGQLGLGLTGQSIATPQAVQSLQAIPFAQLAAGGAHSFALTLSGAVFGWGRNKFGQLGVNDTNGGRFTNPYAAWECLSLILLWPSTDRCFPTLLKSLRSQRVNHVCCGEDHTAVLTKVN